jgi:hypothetical protein
VNSIIKTARPFAQWRWITCLILVSYTFHLIRKMREGDDLSVLHIFSQKLFATDESLNYLEQVVKRQPIGTIFHFITHCIDCSPLCFTWMILLAVKLFPKKQTSLCEMCVTCAIATFVLDTMDNLYMMLMIALYPYSTNTIVITMYSLITSLKWISISCYIIAMGSGIFNDFSRITFDRVSAE